MNFFAQFLPHAFGGWVGGGWGFRDGCKGGVKGLSSRTEGRERVRGVYGFEFARGGEGVGKGGVWV
jgi:hypothetical protein